MGLNIKWDITYKCNLNCEHCINGNFLNNKENEITLNNIETIISKIGESSIDYIHLLGGEPTARKDIVKIGELFKSKNINFGFNTNGLNIMSENIKPIIFNDFLKNIIFSIEGPTQEINDKIRGKNVFNIITKNIKDTISLKKKHSLDSCKISINTVVSKCNYEYIIDMIDFCIDLGVDELNLLQLIPDGNAKDKNLLLSDNDELELVEKIAIKYSSVKNKLIINPKFTRPIVEDYCNKILGLEYPKWTHNCGAGTNFMFIDNKGNISPCDRFKNINNSNLLSKNFNKIWSKPEFAKPFELTEGNNLYKNITPCNSCVHLQSTCYPCVALIESDGIRTINSCSKYFKLLNKETQYA